MRFLVDDFALLPDDINLWKDFQDSFSRLFDVLLLFTGVVALFMTVSHLFVAPRYVFLSFSNLAILLITCPLLVFRKKVSPLVKIWVITGFLFFYVAVSFTLSGSAGTAVISLLSLQMLQIVFHSFKKALPFLLISTLSLLLIGFLSGSKIIVYRTDVAERMQAYFHWLNLFFAVSYFVVLSSITVYGFKNRMLSALRNLGNANEALKTHEKELAQLAYYDTLTRLPNRAWFNRELTRRLEEDPSVSGYLILSEIMNFRTVNSLLGPEQADRLLRILGMFIRSYTKGRFLLGRLNGVEFISWAEGWGEEDLRRSLHSFRIAAKHLVQQRFPGLPFDIMVAAARYPDDAVTLSELHQKGVAAMAEAQQRYQEEIVFFRPSMIEGLNKEVMLHNALEAAIGSGDFLVYYQEQINIRTGEVAGLEVLSRWHNGGEGFVSPDVFIPILTKYNLIIQFSQLVFVKVLEDLPLVVSRYGKEATVSVNISPVFFLSEGFATFIARKLAEHKVPPSSVILEITEDVFIDDLSTIRDIIEEVKALGVSVSLDDFGKGFSSLSYLSSLPLDEVKIDKEFIKTILYDSRQFGVVKSICDLAKILGYQVVIEGIETEEQVQKIKETSCDLVQGYYYSRPAPLRG